MYKTLRRRKSNTATIVGVILLLVFAFAGTGILSLFGLSIYSFEVAGGILLLIIAIRILISGSMNENVESPESIGGSSHRHTTSCRSRRNHHNHI